MKSLVHLIATVPLLLILATCSSKPASESNDSGGENSAASFHADNDIAMTVRSIADAIRIGEPLDSADYDFTGVLTDGQGHPLYTDLDGLPGQWQVDVTSETSAVIRNMNLGDLLPMDLESYLTQSLGLGEDSRRDVSEDPHDDSFRSVYDFGGGYLCIETRTGVTKTGQQAALMSIRTSKRAPI